MRLVPAVALGGALGSAARWLAAGWVQRRLGAGPGWPALFPLGTLAVNLAGCLAIGVLATLFEDRLAPEPALRAFLRIGILGGFTTFSTFAWESLELVRGGGLALAFANLAGRLLPGLTGDGLGTAPARVLVGGDG